MCHKIQKALPSSKVLLQIPYVCFYPSTSHKTARVKMHHIFFQTRSATFRVQGSGFLFPLRCFFDFFCPQLLHDFLNHFAKKIKFSSRLGRCSLEAARRRGGFHPFEAFFFHFLGEGGFFDFLFFLDFVDMFFPFF